MKEKQQGERKFLEQNRKTFPEIFWNPFHKTPPKTRGGSENVVL